VLNTSDFIIYLGTSKGWTRVRQEMVNLLLTAYSKEESDVKTAVLVRNVLVSWAYGEAVGDICHYIEQYDLQGQVRLMVDCGIISETFAKKTEFKTSADGYADWLQSLKTDMFKEFWAISLDKLFIPKHRLEFDSKHVEESGQVSWDNYIYLTKERGVKVMPVFHLNESFKWLDKILSLDLDYFCVGAALLPGKTRERSLDYLFSYLSKQGYKGKLHGLGITETRLLWKHPFYSVDSVSYLSGAMYGRMYGFLRDGKNLKMFTIGSLSKERHKVKAKIGGDKYRLDLFEKIKQQSPWLDLNLDTFCGTQGYYYRVLYNTLIWREFEDKIRQERDFASRRSQRLL